MSANARALATFLGEAGSLVVVSGAGVSTDSGIPDYRDRNGEWKHAKPVQYADFVARPDTRRRYWARSMSGWSRMAGAQPNDAHRALADIEAGGKLDTLITQNVDRLHQSAGSRKVIDLHGTLAEVHCLSCEFRLSRTEWQARLATANAGWKASVSSIRPDGDAELVETDYNTFEVPACPACGGIVKPDVVFFGESVPTARVAAAMAALERAAALLVVGSSLMVFSGYRFARRANELGKPIAIVNRGRTRADDIATLKLDADCAAVLTAAAGMLDV